LKRATKLLKQAQEEETREYVLKFYLTDRPNMSKDNFKTFNQYFEELAPKKVMLDNRSEDEIMQEIMEIENKFGREE
jgi:wyosine [tRNA(Phe)-imidazoG37] synthetase (radical SAM superfamily)